MSVINQMLVDLEERRAVDQPAIEARQTAYVAAGAPRRARRVPRAVVWGFVSVVVAAATYAAHQVSDSDLLSLLDRAASSAAASTRHAPGVDLDNEQSRPHPVDNSAPLPDPHPPASLPHTAVANAASLHETTDALADDVVRERPDPQVVNTSAEHPPLAVQAKPERKLQAIKPPPPSRPTETAVAVASVAAPAELTAPSRTAQREAQVRKVPREPSPEQRFAQLLADARHALAGGDTAQASTLVRHALRLAPGNAAAAELLLAVQLRSGDTDAAITTLRDVLHRDPHNAAYAQALARLLAARGEHQPAVVHLRNALAGGRGDGQSLALLAGLERRIGDHESAAAHYLDALAHDRNVAVWWLGLGMSLERLEQPAEARAAFEEAQRIGGLDGEVAAFLQQRLAKLDAAAAR
ncbi:MAG: tetratricopeptide repeat protein [Gammaproteobacteria bacterium]|nr:tetratricopeptide repeat protein [Gammaproteobacteria bacterium]